MKKMISILAFLMAAIYLTPAAWAKPERLSVKAGNRVVKERAAKAQLKNIDLRSIEDPEARRAIGEILNYLNLQTKK